MRYGVGNAKRVNDKPAGAGMKNWNWNWQLIKLLTGTGTGTGRALMQPQTGKMR